MARIIDAPLGLPVGVPLRVLSDSRMIRWECILYAVPKPGTAPRLDQHRRAA